MPVIQGVDSLHRTVYEIILNCIETGTFLCATTGGEITFRDCRPSSLEAVIDKLVEAGLSMMNQNNYH